jgi:hypothetical protein
MKAEKTELKHHQNGGHVFCICGLLKLRYPDLKKYTVRLATMFALSNLWMMRGKMTGTQG